MSRFVASYDISDNRTRDRISKILGRFGVRLQRSVFEIDIEPPLLEGVLVEIGSTLSREDRFDLIPIDRDERRKRLSWGSHQPINPPVDGL